MKITRLTLYNFGIYAGDNSFSFDSDKPVVLIGGMNGWGKTTFLEAVLLALYGPNSFAFTESQASSYGQYLKSFVNTSDQSLESYVELEFILEEDPSHLYTIHRSWSGSGSWSRETIIVFKDKEEDHFLTDNWSMFIENLLPSALSNFFFFDGEKIAELAMESTDTQMKQSIKALLGIAVLDQLENDVNRIIRRAGRKQKELVSAQSLEQARMAKEEAAKTLEASTAAAAEQNSRIEMLQREHGRLNSEYTAKGGDVLEHKSQLLSQKSALQSRMHMIDEQMLQLSSASFPLALVKDLLEDVHTCAVREKENKLLRHTVNKASSMLEEFARQSDGSVKEIESFITFMDQQVQDQDVNIVYDLSSQTLYQLQKLLQEELPDNKKTFAGLQSSLQEDRSRLEEIENYLSLDVDEQTLNTIYMDMKSKEKEIMDLEVSLKKSREERSQINGTAMRTAAEYGRLLERYLADLELSEDHTRLIKYSHTALHILNTYRIRLQERKIDLLSRTMTECYKRLANKKNLIARVEVDPESLDFSYVGYDGNLIEKESLSAGEKQLMVISLLWALSICSGKKLPVIIDTPLSRMDSIHRMALITTYFPNASAQTIILSTDSEIDSHYYAAMKENIGDEFTLVYDDKTRSTSIHKGYFPGEML